MAKLEQNPKAWEEGFQAGETHKLKCPYPAGTTEAWSWQSGHVEGDAKRQGYSYSRGTLEPKDEADREALRENHKRRAHQHPPHQ